LNSIQFAAKDWTGLVRIGQTRTGQERAKTGQGTCNANTKRKHNNFGL